MGIIIDFEEQLKEQYEKETLRNFNFKKYLFPLIFFHISIII